MKVSAACSYSFLRLIFELYGSIQFPNFKFAMDWKIVLIAGSRLQPETVLQIGTLTIKEKRQKHHWKEKNREKTALYI